MNGFKYCIWVLPAYGHQWYNIVKFPPHLSIKTNLELGQAINLINSFKKEKINILLGDKIETSKENGFNAVYYKIYCKKQPLWWPQNAHISFLYKYDSISPEELKEIEKNIISKNAILNIYKIMYCSGHWSTWKEI